MAAILLDQESDRVGHLCHFCLATPLHQLPFQGSAHLSFCCSELSSCEAWPSVDSEALRSGHLAQFILCDLLELVRLGFIVFHLSCISCFIHLFGIKIMVFLPSHFYFRLVEDNCHVFCFISLTTVNDTFSSVKISTSY